MKKLLTALLLAFSVLAHGQTLVRPLQGGTGIANANLSTWTITGAYPFTGTLTGSTGVTFPTSGTLLTTTGTAANSSQLLGGTWAIPGTIGSTTPNSGAFSALAITGNITVSGNARRYMGDFSNATFANRTYLQSATTNGATVVGLLPNGIGTAVGFNFFNNSDVTAATGLGQFSFTSSSMNFNSTVLNGGTQLPINFLIAGVSKMTIDTSGAISIPGTVSSGQITANLTGNVTGNASGSALTVTQAAQTAITSVGTLTSLAVSGAATVGTTFGVTGVTTLDSYQIFRASSVSMGFIGSYLELLGSGNADDLYVSAVAGKNTYLGGGASTGINVAQATGAVTIPGTLGIGVTPVSKLQVSGHIGTGGSIPAVSACGTGPAITTGSTDTAGEITQGTISTGCVITFAAAYPRAPFCTVTSEAGLAFSYVSAAGTITITNIGALSSTKANYICIQNDLL